MMFTTKRRSIAVLLLEAVFFSILNSVITLDCELKLNPDSLYQVHEGKFIWIGLNCSCCDYNLDSLNSPRAIRSSLTLDTDKFSPSFVSSTSPLSLSPVFFPSTASDTAAASVGTGSFILPENSSLVLWVTSRHGQVVKPSRQAHAFRHEDELLACAANPELCSSLYYILPDSVSGFYLETQRVGRAKVSVTVALYNVTNKMHELLRKNWMKYQLAFGSNSTLAGAGDEHSEISSNVELVLVQRVAFTELSLSVVRKSRIFYVLFDYSAAFIACLTALSVGCCTNSAQLKRHWTSPVHTLLAIGSQHILMPVIAFVVTLILSLPDDIAYGLVAMASMPGGGLAHLVVFLMDADQSLSTAISFLNSILNFVSSFLWLYALCVYWDIPINLWMVFAWLSPVLLSHTGGIVLRHYNEDAAEGVLTWFARPILLLAGILLITLGVYINHYAFHFVNYSIVFAILSLICGGFCFGGILGFLTKREKPVLKTMAAETSVFNCLIVIPTLRYALPQPDGDLAATVPLWGVFFTPTPVVMYFVVHKIKAGVLAFIEKRKEKQYKHYSIVSSLAKMAEDVTALSAPIRVDDGTLKPLEAQERTTCV